MQLITGSRHGIKTPLLRCKNDCYSDAFGMLRQPLQPSAAAAAIKNAAIDKYARRNRKIACCNIKIVNFSIAASIFLLRH